MYVHHLKIINVKDISIKKMMVYIQYGQDAIG